MMTDIKHNQVFADAIQKKFSSNIKDMIDNKLKDMNDSVHKVIADMADKMVDSIVKELEPTIQEQLAQISLSLANRYSLIDNGQVITIQVCDLRK